MKMFALAGAPPVRYALMFTVFSTLVMGVLLAVIYWWVVSLLERHLEESINQQVQVLRTDFEQDGKDSMMGLVRQHVVKHRNSPLHIMVQDRAGVVLAGDLPPIPAKVGWQELKIRPPAGAADGHALSLRGRGEWLDENTFVIVTNDTKDLHESRELIVRSFAVALAGTVALALGGGMLIGVVLLRRAEAVNRTARAIMDGDLSQRIPVVGPRDELGGLAEGLNQMLARIEELMNDLRHVTSDIAHDLRTPLGRLRQRLEVSRTAPRSCAEYEKAIDAAIGDTDILLKTFEAMLRIAQIEAGARRARFTAVDLSAVAENVTDAFAAVAEDQGKQLIARIERGTTVHGDSELLTQMLVNLIENALRHTPGETTIELCLERNDSGARLAVSDDGRGIPAKERDRVLRRFYRLDASRSTQGSGLGLSLVSAVTKLHHATLSLEDNAPGLRAVIDFTNQRTR